MVVTLAKKWLCGKLTHLKCKLLLISNKPQEINAREVRI